MQLVYNRRSTSDEMRVALGRKHQQPFKLVACARRRGKLRGRAISDGIQEMLSAMKFILVSTWTKR